jgi:hypothetical protein
VELDRTKRTNSATLKEKAKAMALPNSGASVLEMIGVIVDKRSISDELDI